MGGKKGFFKVITSFHGRLTPEEGYLVGHVAIMITISFLCKNLKH